MLGIIGKVDVRHALAFAAAFLFMTAATALAQNAGTVDGGAVPPRNGNVYDHRNHQPTQAEDAAGGIAPPSAGGAEQVEQEVKELLQQTDILDRESEQHERGLSPGSAGRN